MGLKDLRGTAERKDNDDRVKCEAGLEPPLYIHSVGAGADISCILRKLWIDDDKLHDPTPKKSTHRLCRELKVVWRCHA